MALYNLSFITQAYVELIKRAFSTSPGWAGPIPAITPISPYDLKIEGISFYLYHVLESKVHANFPVTAGSNPAIKFLPMALSLYYQLTAHSNFAEENGPYHEQLMMSIAMKALHDCPYMDDDTLVDVAPGVPKAIMPLLIQGMENRFRIEQLPLPYSEAVHNWTAGPAPMKLSAYYEVSVAFLEPDETKIYTGRVLAYGNYVFTSGAPKITGSQNIITFTIPGGLTSQIKIQPAQSPPAPPLPAAIPQESIVSFFGSGFNGDDVQIRLFNPSWQESVIAGPDWKIEVGIANNVTMTVQETAVLEKNGTSVDVLPGLYSAQAIVTRTVKIPGGQIKDFKNASNQFPFVVAPRVDSITNVGGLITIKGYLFKYIVGVKDVLADSIAIYCGVDQLTRSTAALPSPGEFIVKSADTIQFKFAAGTPSGENIPLRILISGAESLPIWIAS